jgi:hypothetical protein
MAQHEANVSQQIDNQINPPILVEQAPWLISGSYLNL